MLEFLYFSLSLVCLSVTLIWKDITDTLTLSLSLSLSQCVGLFTNYFYFFLLIFVDGHCAQTPEILSWMDEIANSGSSPEDDEAKENVAHNKYHETNVPSVNEEKQSRIKRDLNMNEDSSVSSSLVGQNGRQFNQYNRPYNNRARQQDYEAQGRISFGFR